MTLVFFHAHPDDEAIASAGTMSAAVEAGHRVVVVLATRGERGNVPDDLGEHASLADLRTAEAERAGEILGVDRVAFLGYRDSGMDPEIVADDPGCFAAAGVDEAAERLADLLTAEAAEVLVVYDPTGVTGHPDHLQVHVVGYRAAELMGARAPRVYESTLPRSQGTRVVRAARAHAAAALPPGTAPDPEPDPEFGTPDEDVTFALDVRGWLELKRAAMAAHASQMPADSWFLATPDFDEIWGREHYIDRTAGSPGLLETLAPRI